LRDKPWTIPVIILIILIFAWYFRWSYDATKTFDIGSMKWKTDRWTGQKWLEAYMFDTNTKEFISGEAPVQPSVADYSILGEPDPASSVRKSRKWMESTWKIAISATTFWLIYLLFMKERIKNLLAIKGTIEKFS